MKTVTLLELLSCSGVAAAAIDQPWQDWRADTAAIPSVAVVAGIAGAIYFGAKAARARENVLIAVSIGMTVGVLVGFPLAWLFR